MKHENRCCNDLELDDAIVIAVGAIAIVGIILMLLNMSFS